MALLSYLPTILTEFEKWYNNNQHKVNHNFYNKTITYSNLNNLNPQDFIDFFYDFVDCGGKVQSGGYRAKNNFEVYAKSNYLAFRTFVLEPFNNNFNIDNWFKQIGNHKHFGIGIATIYLNRINDKEYSILNNKTLSALIALGYNISHTENLSNYKKVNDIQKNLIKLYPTIITDLFVADSLNHFLIGTDEGKKLVIDLSNVNDSLEQEEIIDDIESDQNFKQLTNIKSKIQQLETDKNDIITVNLKRYKRSAYLMSLIKKYRNYTCQFCPTKIIKEHGGYYIEACHIVPKANNGKDTLNNILVLCPTCHKRFDYAKRVNIVHTSTSYTVELNGQSYTATLV